MSVSIILPIYNAEPFLAECVESILGQTYGDFELIAVDDGSTDASGDILRRYASADRRIRGHHFDRNVGEVAAMRYGVSRARHGLHARMDHDDVCAPDRLERQVRAFAAHPEVTVVGSNTAFFGAVNGDTDVPTTDALIKANFIVARGNILNPTAMWRAGWFGDHGVRYGDLKNVSDFGMWVDCMLAGGRFLNLPDRLVRHRVHPGQASMDFAATNAGVQIILSRLVGRLFPDLAPAQAAALARICHGVGEVSIKGRDLALAFNAAAQVATDMTSRYGEDRQALHHHIGQRAKLIKDAFGL